MTLGGMAAQWLANSLTERMFESTTFPFQKVSAFFFRPKHLLGILGYFKLRQFSQQLHTEISMVYRPAS